MIMGEYLSQLNQVRIKLWDSLAGFMHF